VPPRPRGGGPDPLAEYRAKRDPARTAEPVPAAGTPLPTGHVFTLHAELEGMRYAPVLEQLISGWKAQGYAVSSVRSMVDAVEPLALPRCSVGIGTVPGRSGTLFVQQDPFPGDALPQAA